MYALRRAQHQRQRARRHRTVEQEARQGAERRVFGRGVGHQPGHVRQRFAKRINRERAEQLAEEGLVRIARQSVQHETSSPRHAGCVQMLCMGERSVP